MLVRAPCGSYKGGEGREKKKFDCQPKKNCIEMVIGERLGAAGQKKKGTEGEGEGAKTMRFHKSHMFRASLSPLPACIRHDLMGILNSRFIVMADRVSRRSMGRIGVS